MKCYWKVRYSDRPRSKGWVSPLWQYLTAPMPLDIFHKDYNQYWEIRGDIREICNRWKIAEGIIENGASLLDVGCGSGDFLAHLKSRKPDVRIAALDMSGVAVEMTRKKGFEAQISDLTKQDIDSDYDFITCFEVLEHVQDAEIVFAKMLKHVRKKLIISLPIVGCLRCRLRLALFGRFPTTMIVLHIKEHVRFWTAKDFKEWAGALGGDVIAVYGQYGSKYLPWRRFPGLFAWGNVYVVEPRRLGVGS